jgi:subtilase family serine protease
MKAFVPRASKPRLAGTLIALVLFCTLSLMQQSSAQQQAALETRAPLIVQPVDESQLTVLHGNTHPLARPQFDLGTAPATLPMERMLLVLKRSSEQEAALRKLLDDQQDKASPSYHKWLTPAEYGKQFGPTDTDIQTITAWLQSHGFEVGTTKGRTVLEFSGSASQVQEAFHTTIHKYIVNGEQHWANASDPQIPTALTPAVAGVLTLHNFIKKPAIHFTGDKLRAKVVPGIKPQVTFPPQNGQPAINALGPQDYAVIYNIKPVYTNNIVGDGIETLSPSGFSTAYLCDI